ncbi:MAG: DUF433 domain-containing protein [Cyclobacteriaceae bacterium]|nr:DUF433 domain-containing protein [Cyclobacteriaceae bacterium]MBX2957566.1 DUF433 domain-containing protein [Cyclobacteriaceae bacterium]
MEWRGHITSNKEILGGKPIVKGTRLSVEFLLGLFANGWSEESVLKNYPTLKKDDILALFAYAQDSVKDDLLIGLKS